MTENNWVTEVISPSYRGPMSLELFSGAHLVGVIQDPLVFDSGSDPKIRILTQK